MSNQGCVKSSSTESCKTTGKNLKHPYEDELSRFRPHPWQLEHREVELYKSVDETPFTFVNKKDLFIRMLLKLENYKEVAMDVEHHDLHSFKGVVCLVQISTRDEDFVIDAIELKECMSQLNKICTNSSILKVLHAGEKDIEWLQKDFSIFLVNMFDTQKAANALQEEYVGLAYLLKKYCGVQVNKGYQRADWRIRPLTDKMLRYARGDTHFLLYIKDLFQNALLKCKSAKLMDVYKSSTEICRSLYREPVFQPDAYLTCYRSLSKRGLGLGTLKYEHMECFRLLYEWRYHVSMEIDKGTGYTLPNKMMLKISRGLPQDPDSVFRCCMPMEPSMQKIMKKNQEAICRVVLQAISNGPRFPKEERSLSTPGSSGKHLQGKNKKKNRKAKLKAKNIRKR